MTKLEKLAFYNRNYIGERVICRSNEDEPLMIGKIDHFENFDNDDQEPLPIVIDEDNGKDWLVMGIIRLYSNELFNALNKLTYREQWVIMGEGKL